MGEPLKKEDMIRGVIVNADEYKSDDLISPVKITATWVNTENLESAIELLKETIRTKWDTNDHYIKELFGMIDQSFPEPNTKNPTKAEKGK